MCSVRLYNVIKRIMQIAFIIIIIIEKHILYSVCLYIMVFFIIIIIKITVEDQYEYMVL